MLPGVNPQNRRTILVTGATGFVGGEIFSYFTNKGYNVFGVGRNTNQITNVYRCDLRDKENIKKMLKELTPEIIIHAAALTNVDLCERDKKAALENNVKATENIVNNIDKNKIKFIFISSDYVYEGKKGPYKESSFTNPVNYYGKTKILAEEVVRKVKKHLILRTGGVFGFNLKSKNFMMQLLEKNKLKENMNVPIDQINNPTFIKTLLIAIDKCVENEVIGTFNLTGKESISRYNLAKLMCNTFKWDFQLVKGVKTETQKNKTKRPLDCATDSSKIQELLNYPFPSLVNNLQEINKKLLENTKNKEGGGLTK